MDITMKKEDVEKRIADLQAMNAEADRFVQQTILQSHMRLGVIIELQGLLASLPADEPVQLRPAIVDAETVEVPNLISPQASVLMGGEAAEYRLVCE